ncbi:hypothetical protein FRC05_003366 [Tulasnella sp. 425]|nr:hypothetical protein FRC05_003366 [Tulasnella sp. 425]
MNGLPQHGDLTSPPSSPATPSSTVSPQQSPGTQLSGSSSPPRISLQVAIMQAGVSKGKAKGDSNEPMELLDNETFLERLKGLFEGTKSQGTVWLTQKRYAYDPNGGAVPVSQNDEVEYKCLLRATDGHAKFETLISSAELGKFHAVYAALLKASMTTLRKRDKKKEKQKAEQAALWKKKLVEDIIIEGAKRGNGRRKRVRRIKAAIRQDEERKAAAKREEQRLKSEPGV